MSQTGGPAARAGVRKDDVITTLGGRAVDGKAEMVQAVLERSPPGTKVTLALERDDKELTVELTLAPAP